VSGVVFLGFKSEGDRVEGKEASSVKKGTMLMINLKFGYAADGVKALVVSYFLITESIVGVVICSVMALFDW
jgi:hypothetical protein